MELYHHGIKGQKWGVRRYQYADGTYTPAGRKRYGVSQNASRMERMASTMEMRVKDCVNTARTQVTGRQYVDGYLKKGTTFSRIQTSKDFENFAFYATYKKADSDKYMGLFGKNLMTRANYDAKQAEKQANASGSEAAREGDRYCSSHGRPQGCQGRRPAGHRGQSGRLYCGCR